MSRYWTKVDGDLGGLESAAIVDGTSEAVSNDDAFWIMGGLNYEKEVLNQTLYLDVKTTDNGWHPGIDLPIPVYGHCATRVKFPLTDNDNFEATIIMGGYEGLDRFRVQSTNKSFAYCQNNENINLAVCNNEESGGFGWSSLPEIKSILYGYYGFGYTYCTQFQDQDLCDGVCIMATGTWTKFSEYFPLERCAKTGADCEWKNEIGGKELSITDLYQHGLGGMTTLDGVPTLFLPLYNNTGISGWQEKWVEVLQFIHMENGAAVDEWRTLEKWETMRGSFVTLSVPKDFLCNQDGR